MFDCPSSHQDEENDPDADPVSPNEAGTAIPPRTTAARGPSRATRSTTGRERLLTQPQSLAGDGTVEARGLVDDRAGSPLQEEPTEVERGVGERDSLLRYRGAAALGGLPPFERRMARRLADSEYELDFLVSENLGTSVIGQPTGANPIVLMTGVELRKLNFLRKFDRNRPLEPGDILTVEAGLQRILQLRRQFPLLEPATKLYRLLGRQRGVRLLYQIAFTEEAYIKFDKTEFFLEYSAACIGRNAGRSLVLVEAYPEEFKSRLSKHPGVVLVAPVPNSTPPRSTTLGDNFWGFFVLLGFFATLAFSVAAGFDPTGPFGIFDVGKEFPLFFFLFACIGRVLVLSHEDTAHLLCHTRTALIVGS